MKKYEFTGETKMWFGRKLLQIRALIKFADVEPGELGGWIEGEKNLAHDDNAWVFGNALVYGDAMVYGNARVSGNAMVYGDARVYGDALVCGNAWVYGNAMVCGNARVYGNYDHLVVGPIGSRKAYTTFYRRRDGVTMVVCGCFHDTIEAFEDRVRNVHGDNAYGRAYQAVIAMARVMINTEPAEGDNDE